VNEAPASSKQLWLRIARWAMAVIVTVFLVRAVADASASFDREQFSLSRIQFSWLVAAGVAYLLGLLPMGLYWHYMLHVLGQRPGLGQTLRAYYVSHLGKYVPGKAMVVLLRMGLLRGGRFDSTLVAVSVFAETLTMMAVGAFLAAGMLAARLADHRGLLLLACGLMVVAGLPTVPPVFRRLIRGLRVHHASPQAAQALDRITLRVIAIGWLCNAIGWLLLAFSLWAVLRALPLAEPLAGFPQLMPRLVASVSLAVVAGFLSLLPGGLGVREWVLNELMIEPFGRVVAVSSAVLLRLVWLLSELLVSIILYMTVRSARQP